MNNGWIKIHRKLLDNPVSSKPNYLVIWIYLLLSANHQDREIIWNNKKITIKAGSFIGSLRKISRYYGISISTVKYIIDYLVSEQMIEHKGNGNFSLFTIRKWKHYQMVEHPIEHEQNTDKTRIKTNKNDKNDKNIPKGSKQSLQVNQLVELFKPLNPLTYRKWYVNKTQRLAIDRLNKALGAKLEIAINTAVQANSMKYAPTITTPLQLEEKLSALRAFVAKEQGKGKRIIGL